MGAVVPRNLSAIVQGNSPSGWFVRYGRLLPVLLAMTLGCNSNSIFGVEAPGEAARVAWVVTQAAGGQAYETSMVVDSATGHYELRRCQGPFSSPCVTTEERAGSVSSDVLLELFEVAQSPEFRELRSEYRRRGNVVPPDGGSTQLVVVVGERRKEIDWDNGIEIPEVLRTFECLMLAATESPLCD